MPAPPTPAVPAVKSEDLDPSNLMTTCTSSVITIAGGECVFATVSPNAFPNLAANPTFVRRIYCCTSGSIAIKRVNDAAFTVYPCTQGQYIDGYIIAIGNTTDGTTNGLQFIAEL